MDQQTVRTIDEAWMAYISQAQQPISKESYKNARLDFLAGVMAFGTVFAERLPDGKPLTVAELKDTFEAVMAEGVELSRQEMG